MKRRIKESLLIILSIVLAISMLGCVTPDTGEGSVFFNEESRDNENKWGVASQTEIPGTTSTPTQGATETPELNTETTISPDETTESYSESWTIMLYINGADLESDGGEATANLISLLDVSLPESINVLVYTGGTRTWQNDIISSNNNQIYKVENQSLTLLQNLDIKNMGESATLTEFITYAQTNYPADKKALFFWNHGAGSVDGFGTDELYNYDSLRLSEMQSAFAQSFDGQKFDLVGFDACLMATVEMASVLEPYAQYMVASEEIEPGGGWNYEYYYSALAGNPGMTGEELGIAITDGYYQKYANTENESIITCSVIDLSKIPALEETLGVFATKLSESIVEPKQMNIIAKYRNQTESYGEEPGSIAYDVSYDMVDLYNFVDLQKEMNPQLSEDLMNAIEDAVVYDVKGSQRIDSYGLSIFFPHNGEAYFEEYLPIYNQLDFCPEYKQFVSEYASNKTDQAYLAETPDFENAVFESEGDPEGDYIEVGSYFVQLTDEEVQYMSYVYCVLGWYMDNGDLIDLGYDSDLTINYETNTYYDDFDGSWTGLNGQPVALYIMEETDDYVVYNIPVLYNGDKAVISGSWIWDSTYEEGGYYTYNGMFYTNDEYSAPSTKFSIELQVGDAITPLYTTLYAEDGYDGYYEGDTFYLDENGLYLELIWLPDGIYEYGFAFVDNNGEYHYSQTIDFELYS